MEVGLRVGGLFFLFKQKTAYEVRISDWSSDVCPSDLCPPSPKSLTWLGFWRAGRSGVVPLIAFSSMITRLFPALCPSWPPGGRGHERRRSAERRVGNGCVGTCRSRWSPYH